MRQEPIRALNKILDHIGVNLVPPVPGRGGTAARDTASTSCRQLPRSAVLVPVKGSDRPVVVDAWLALQTLRAAHQRRRNTTGRWTGRCRPDRARTPADRLGHHRQPAGTAGGITGSPGNSGGVTGPTSTDSYLFSGGDTRTPVAVLLDPPPQAGGRLRDVYGRRPVVAVLDTGVRAHPWLDVTADGAGGYTDPPDGDGFVASITTFRTPSARRASRRRRSGDKPRQVIRHPWDTPITADPLIGELDPDPGHGTFISGIVRQLAPDARVLAVRIMHSDGVCLRRRPPVRPAHLANRVALAEAGDPARMVDVVSLSLGYFSESRARRALTSGLWQAIEAAARPGCRRRRRGRELRHQPQVLPGGVRAAPVPAGQVPLISVGALNPNGSKAMFSDGGHWVTAWASGAAVVSTYADGHQRQPQP